MKSFRLATSLALWSLSLTAWSNEPVLEAEFERLAEQSGGTMGVAAIHIESGRTAFLNPDEPFPMASTYKVPIATLGVEYMVRTRQVLNQSRLRDLGILPRSGAGNDPEE